MTANLATLIAAPPDQQADDLPVVIVALPMAGEPVNDIGAEEKHVTLAYLGSTEQIIDLAGLIAHVGMAASTYLPFTGVVNGIDALGDDDPQARVAMLDSDGPAGMRDYLLNDEVIGTQHASVEQKWPDYTPHVTLDYATSVPGEDAVVGTVITFDRLALWAGDTRTEFPLGDEMNESDTDIEAELAAEATGMPVPWHGVLAPEDVTSGDKRKFKAGGLRFRDLPLPLSWQKANLSGHDGSVVVGRIDGIERSEGVMRAWGVIGTSAEADEALTQLAEGFIRGVSVDVDDVTFGFEDEAGNPIEGDAIFLAEEQHADPIMVVSDGRISGATLCAIPAFQEAHVDLGPPPDDWGTGEVEIADDAADMSVPAGYVAAAPPPVVDAGGDLETGDAVSYPGEDGDGHGTITAIDGDTATVTPDDGGDPITVPIGACTKDDADDNTSEDGYSFKTYDKAARDEKAGNGQAMPDGSYPIADEEDLRNAIQAIGRAKDPEAAKAHIKKRASSLGKSDLIPDTWAVATFVDTHDGPGWITNPEDTQRLREYWVYGAGAGKIKWGAPGDFNRCRSNLGKYVAAPFLAGTCANLHYEALGYWPNQGPHATGKGNHGHKSALEPGAAITLPQLVASAADTIDAFSDPQLGGPTPLTVTSDGRVFGHLATWGTCHVGFGNHCVTPPSSSTNYAYFLTGELTTSDGIDVPVGQITMGTGHADPSLQAAPAVEHYDHTGAAVADVTAGDDAYGVWVAGRIRENVPAAQVSALRAGALSGDWRRIGGNLELVAALAVNVPGFPIPRVQSSLRGGRQLALVASGVVAPAPAPVEMMTASAFMREIKAAQRRERIALRAAAKIGRDPKSRALAAAGRVHTPEGE